MYLEFIKDQSLFSWEELKHLASAMGFFNEVFEKNIPKEYRNDSDYISVRDVVKCIDERCFHVDLHYTGNFKSGAYNATCLKKAVQFISKRYLSFKELLDVRLSFQAYEEYDQKGMKINEYTLLRCLKMCGRVISPKKLMHKVKHLKASYKERGRIQFFEFLDLLVLCEVSNKYQVAYDLNSSLEKTWTQLYKLDNFKHFAVPRDKNLWIHLNKEYTEKELNCVHPELRSLPFVEYPLKMDDFRTQVKLSNSYYEMLHRSLRNSNKQVQLAKGGFSYARPQKKDVYRQAASASNAIASQAATTGKSGRMLTPAAFPRKFSSPGRSKKTQRPQSSPPVVSAAVLKEIRTKIENVEFDICTENQRWSKHYLSNIKTHLPNYPEVLERMVKAPSAPRRQRLYRRERPSQAAITRLASHETKPPLQHIERCDALTRGIGTDLHSSMLTKQAKKIRCKSAPAASLRQKSASALRPRRKFKYSMLLATLMREYDYESETDSAEAELAENVFTETLHNSQCHADEIAITLSSADSNEENTKQAADQVELTENIEEMNVQATYLNSATGMDEMKREFLVEFFKWKTDKLFHIKDFVEKSGYYQTCIDPAQEHKKPLAVVKARKSPHSLKDSKISRRLQQTHREPPSDFEKHISQQENIRIPHDVLLVEKTDDCFEKMQRTRSLKRIAQRYPIEERKWFTSLAQKQSSEIMT